MGRLGIGSKRLAIVCVLLLSGLAWRPGAAWALNWQFIGPAPITSAQANYGGDLVGPIFAAAGRVTAIAPDLNTQGRIFVGTANGGLWMIAGANGPSPSYTRISDTLPNPTQAIGAIALDPSTSPPTIYVGTGEGNDCGDCYYGRGLFYSTDLGNSWTELDAGDFEIRAFTKLAVVNDGNGTNYLFAGITQGDSVNRAGAIFRQGNPAFDGLYRITRGTSAVPVAYPSPARTFSSRSMACLQPAARRASTCRATTETPGQRCSPPPRR